MNKVMNYAIVAAVVVASNTAFAGGVFAPMGLDSASVMPKGIRSFRLGGFTTEVADKYDGSGSILPLAHGFNKPVTWGELIASRPSAEERGYLRGGLQSEGIQMDDILGDANGMVNARITSTVPVFAWGITDKVTLGVGLPVVYSNTSVATGWTVTAQGQSQINQLIQTGNGARIEEYSSLLYNVVATKIAAYGYKPLVSEEKTDLGDLNVGLKVLAYSKNRLSVAVSPKLIVPTGREADIDKVVDLAPGGGIWAAGVSTVTEYGVTPKWSLLGSVGYTYQAPAEKAMRVPRSDSESISPDIDPNVQKKLGDLMSASVGSKYKFTTLLTGGVAYSMQYKESDSYSGSRFEKQRYTYLERNSWQNMQSALASLTYSTIPLYRAGSFALPLDATLSYSQVIDGRNVSRASLAVFEIAAYF